MHKNKSKGYGRSLIKMMVHSTYVQGILNYTKDDVMKTSCTSCNKKVLDCECDDVPDDMDGFIFKRALLIKEETLSLEFESDNTVYEITPDYIDRIQNLAEVTKERTRNQND